MRALDNKSKISVKIMLILHLRLDIAIVASYCCINSLTPNKHISLLGQTGLTHLLSGIELFEF